MQLSNGTYYTVTIWLVPLLNYEPISKDYVALAFGII